jgi:trigger factor
MAAATDVVKTTVTELEESRVKVDAEVSPKEVQARLDEAARRLGRDMRVPGFRKGKVPPPVIIRQVGREAILDEAVRSSIGRWYVDAIDDAGIVPVGDPDLDLSDLPDAGAPLKFTFEVGVRPTATLGEYKGLEVPRREPAAADEAVQAELEQLRERSAGLETKDGESVDGDFVVMDFVGSVDGVEFEGGDARDYLLELGSNRFIPGFEEQLVGVRAGEEKTVEVTFPDEYQAEHLAGKAAQFAVTVKEVKEKKLPELDDDFASDNAGFDTLDELKEDIATKLRESDEQALEGEYREAVLDAVVGNATVEVPETLVDARAKELWERMTHSLSHQGINKDMYLQISGKTEEEVLEEAKPDAEQALKREAVLAAVIEAEGLEPSDGDVLDALQATAAREDVKVEKLRDRLEKNGRLDELKSDLAQNMAVDFLVEQAKPVPAPAAAAE